MNFARRLPAMDSVLEKGMLLVAGVELLDANFRHSVILLGAHEPQGSYGLVLNRPVRPPAELRAEVPYLGERVYVGGPVQPEMLQVLHPYGELPDAAPILPGVFIGGDFDVLGDGILSGVFDRDLCRFFLGYAGWDHDQLYEECLQQSWLTAPATAELVLMTPPQQLWPAAVRACAVLDPVYRYFPDNCQNN